MLKPSEKNIPQPLPLKWKDKFLGVVASIITALLLLATNALLKGMELDIADAILVQSFSQIVIFLILLATKRAHYGFGRSMKTRVFIGSEAV